MKIILLISLLTAGVAVARPEPPSPNSRYNAPSQYNTLGDSYAPPPQQYNAPSDTYGPPSQQYNAPSSQYGPPSQLYNAPSSQYGPPSQQYNAPSSQYGAPSQQYNAPVRSAAKVSSRIGGAGKGLRRGGAPASTYGAPAITSARFSSAAPAPAYGAPAPVYGPPGYDARAGLAQDDLAEPANYEYQYAVEDNLSGVNFGHQEDRQEDSAKGEYRVLLPDGRTLIVEYEADEGGYRPSIRYEEAQGPYPAARGPQGPY